MIDRTTSGIDRLSGRERDVIRLAAEDFGREDTAERLGISPETVRTHRMNAMRKLSVHHIAGAVGLACREGLFK